MTTALTDITALEPGQTLRVAVDAGSWVRVVEGKVQVLSPPAWLGETVFNARARLRAEDVHVVEGGGWIEVVAHTAARVQVLSRPVPVRSLNTTRLGRWVQLLAGRLPSDQSAAQHLLLPLDGSSRESERCQAHRVD